MKFIVATHSFLLLVDVDLEFNATTTVLDRNYFDGVDVMPDGLILGCYKQDHWSKTSPAGFRWYTTDGPNDLIPAVNGDDIYDPHQITFSADGRGVWNCSTATNEIVHKSIRNSDLDYRVRFQAPTDGDWSHINSICVRGPILYAVFHNLAREPSDVRKFDRDFNLLEIQTLPHWSIHNFEIEDSGNFYYNASDNGRVMRGRWGTGGYDEALVGEQWHPKGMALTPEYVVSGWSEHAVSTPRRFISRSGLVFVDRKTWEIAGRCDILVGDSFVGNINDVRYYNGAK